MRAGTGPTGPLFSMSISWHVSPPESSSGVSGTARSGVDGKMDQPPKCRHVRLSWPSTWCYGPSTTIADLSPSRPVAIGSARNSL